jgi:hypothetical protein
MVNLVTLISLVAFLAVTFVKGVLHSLHDGHEMNACRAGLICLANEKSCEVELTIGALANNTISGQCVTYLTNIKLNLLNSLFAFHYSEISLQ